jgi:2-polyprenyl-6-methoxyphenol hydroxylase-like FAD-dependent oxidoreductase
MPSSTRSGRTAGVTGARGALRAVFHLASPPLEYDRHDVRQQKQIVARAFEGMAWETPRLIAGMHDAHDFYFDSISEIHMPALSRGRVALLGDAGYGGTLGGMGTGVAVVGAYVLAGELAAARGDHEVAFACYEDRIRDYAARCQRGARGVGAFMAPRTRLGIAVRNRTLRLAYLVPGKGMMERIAMKRATSIAFGNYPR